MRSFIARYRRSDDGFTLIELLSASLLLILVVTVVGGIMASTANTQGTVANVTSATNSGQSATNSIESGIRNSELSVGATAPFYLGTPTSTTDQILIAEVLGVGATPTEKCRAWYYSSSSKTIRTTTTTSTISKTPASSVVSSWTLLASGVSPVTGTTIFTALTTSRLQYAFAVAAGRDPSVTFSSSISGPSSSPGNLTCY